MTIEADVQTALQGFVDGRCYQDTFPQVPAIPVMPAIRFTVISVVPPVDICGDGGDETADVRVQIDIVAVSVAVRRTVRAQVMAAMAVFTPPAIWDGEQRLYEPDTKAYRSSLDYLIYPSSDEDSP